MKWLLGGILAFCSAVISACSTTPVLEPSQSASDAVESISQSGLPAQELAFGECGLFLYSLSGEPRFVFFTKATDSSAKLLIGSEVERLRETSASGEIFGQFMTQTSWVTERTGQSVNLVLEPGESLIDGQRVAGGRIKITDQEGWETIIPVGGVRACLNRPESALGQTP